MGYKKVSFRHSDALANMPWDEFERLMARHYAARGYRVEHTGTGAKTSLQGFDGGIDLKLYRGDEYIVVQCKRESALQVTHNVVHQLIGVMHTQRATGAIVVNTGEFSTAAIEAASKITQIELVDGMMLRRMLAATGDMPSAASDDDVLAAMAWPGRRKAHGRQSFRPWRMPAKSTLGLFAAKAILGIGVPAVVALIVIPHILKNAADSMIQGSQRTTSPRAVPQTARVAAPVFTPMPSRTVVPSGQSTSAVAPPEPAFTKLSKKQSEEWDKKNAESMRILEKTTPTLE